VKTVDALHGAGAISVYACAATLCFRPGDRPHRRFATEQVVVTDTIPLREQAQKLPKIKVLSIAGLLARRLRAFTWRPA